jgi:hypothetical protein
MDTRATIRTEAANKAAVSGLPMAGLLGNKPPVMK